MEEERGELQLLIYILLSIIILSIDQGVKYLVVTKMYPGQSIPIIHNVFHLTYVRNPGAAFGILADKKYLFVIITLLVIGLILYFFRQIPRNFPLMKVSFALILAGAFGNMIDRLNYGYVVDLFDFRIWYIFNIADAAIVIGIILFIYTFWKLN